jgi:hypothetical protein
MKIILFFLVLLLLLVFTNNKKEFFTEKIVGDISFEDYIVDDEKMAKFYSDKLLEPRKMNYTLGEEGKGVEEEINTLSFKPENIKNILGENAIKKVGGKEMTNIEAVVPVLFYGSQQNFKKINNILVDMEKLKAEIIELKK